ARRRRAPCTAPVWTGPSPITPPVVTSHYSQRSEGVSNTRSPLPRPPAPACGARAGRARRQRERARQGPDEPETVTPALHHPLGGVPVPVGISGQGHARVGAGIGEEPRRLLDDPGVVRSDQAGRPRGDPLRALRRLPEDQDRPAEG